VKGFIKKGLLWPLFFVLCACGYHVGIAPTGLPPYVKTIYIGVFKNPTNELKLGAQITEKLREEFIKKGGLKLAPKDKADVILEGKILSVSSTGVAYVRYNVSVEREITARFSAKLIDTHTGKVLMTFNNLSRSENFLVGTNVMATQTYKSEALDKISQYIAEVIHHKIVDSF